MSAFAACLLAVAFPPRELPPDPAPAHECGIDLRRVGQMEDVLSNALMRGLDFEGERVRAYLTTTRETCADGAELLARSAEDFGVDRAKLAGEAERFRHVNCGLATQAADEAPLSRFAQDVALHVVLHELGHALIREFDLPVLGNEEMMADAFATTYLTTHLPERALDVLRAADYGAEVHRSWRRMLEPLWMPKGQASAQAALEIDGDGPTLADLRSGSLPAEIEAILRRFDRHSQVEVRFVEGDGRAGWSRSARAVTVHGAYVRRFIAQGEALARPR